MTRGERSKEYVKGQYLRSSVHLVPFFGNMDISKITTGKIVDYRVHRHQQAIVKRGKPPAHSTMHHEIVTLRQTLKTALCQGWLDRLPDFSEPYRRSSKVSYRAWFSPEEYEKLCEATRKRALEPKKKGFRWQAEQLHDYVLFAGNTGCGLMRHGALNSAMSRSLTTSLRARRFLRLKCAENGDSGIARVCPVQSVHLSDSEAGSVPGALTACVSPPKCPTILMSSGKNGAGPNRPTSFSPNGRASSSRPSLRRKIFGSTETADRVRRTAYGTRISACG